MQEQVRHLMRLFDGSEVGFGQFTDYPLATNGKIRGRAVSLAGAKAGEKEWQKHLDGEVRLGIPPVRRDGTCVFSVIDVDYDCGDIPELLKRKWPEHECPVIYVKSKSGGAHLFKFFAPTHASVVKSNLLCDVHDLGLDLSRVDVFPRAPAQFHDNVVGSWILMPYFGGKGGPLSLDEFIERAELEVLRSVR